MYTASITVAGVDELNKALEAKAKDIEPILKKIALDTQKQMRSYIKPRRKGSTGTLSKSIKIYKRRSGKGIVSYHVGDPADMPEYWYVVNYGGYTPPPTRGYFGNKQAPRGGIQNERWHYKDSNSFYYIKPNKQIRPMRFIEKTQAYVAKKFDRDFKNLF